MLIWIVNSANMDNMNIVHSVGIFSDNAAMNIIFNEYCST